MAGSLPLCCVNHISRVVSDVQASTAFYRDILGFGEVKRPSSFEFGGSWLWRYSVGIHLIEGVPVKRSAEINPKADHLSFQADSLKEVQRRLDEMGIHYMKQTIFEGGVQVEQVFFHDPDNNMIEVCNCNCLPILPVEQQQAACLPCALATSTQVEEAARNNQCGGLQDSGDEEEATGFHPAQCPPACAVARCGA